MIRAMQMFLEFLPLAAFLIVYKFFGGDQPIYPATLTLMVGMVLSLAILWLRAKRMPAMFAASTALVLAFGVLTLWLRNAHFIQWKPTILMWATALAFLLSAFIGQKPLVQRMLAPVLGDQARLTRTDWLKLNTAWVVYSLVIGAVNLALVYNVSEEVWVDVKIPLMMGSMVVFVVAQILWLQRRTRLPT